MLDVAIVARAMVLLCVAGCADSCNPTPDPDGPIVMIEVLPPRVEAVDGQSFELDLRLRDQDGNILPAARASEVKWTHDPGLTLSALSGAPVKVVASLDANTPPLTLRITATANGKVGNGEIRLSDVPAAMDWVESEHQAGDAPMLTLVDGQSDDWRSDSAVAFVSKGPLDAFGYGCDGTNCGEITFFSPRHRVLREEPAWSNACEAIQFTSSPGSGDCAATHVQVYDQERVEVRIWTLTTNDVTAAINSDLALANRVLVRARSGLLLAPVPAAPLPGFNVVLDVSGPSWACPLTTGPYALKTQLLTAGVSPSTFSEHGVTVVYVDEIMSPTGGGTGPSGYKGYSCPWASGDGTIVLISVAARHATTFAHELGHAFGPWTAAEGFGHTTAPHFDKSNLMWDAAYPVPVPREFLTLGQVFRVNLQSGSILHRPPSTTEGLRCSPPDAAERPCPALHQDVSK